MESQEEILGRHAKMRGHKSNRMDAVATGADEVGIAMQKTAASAGIANLTLEQTSAIIGTISSITREAAEVIGTSVNAMISRYAKITQTGMNQIFQDEDGQMVAVNDIAKALATIDIELYNTQTGFTGLWDILSQVNQQWDTMDDGQRNYIATMFAGTRQMNRFVALMENFDMAMELNEGAMNSSGLAAEKYAIWQESAAAAQNNFNSALENLYASFIEGGTITSFYNTLAGLIDLITDGFNSGVGQMVMVVGGATVVIGGIVSVFKALGPAITAATAAEQAYTAAKAAGVGVAQAATAATTAYGTAVKLAVPVFALAAAGIMLLFGAIAGIPSELESATEAVEEMRTELSTIDNNITNLNNVKKQLDELGEKAYLTSTDMETLANIKQTLIDQFPQMAEALGDEAASIEEVNNAIRDQIELENARARVSRAENREAMETVWDSQFDGADSTQNWFNRDDYRDDGSVDISGYFDTLLGADFDALDMRDLLKAQNVFDWIETNAPYLITEEAERIQGTIKDRLSILASEAKSSYASDIQGYIMDAIFPEGTEALDESQLAVWENIASGLQEQVSATIDEIISGTLTDEELNAAMESLSMDSMMEYASLIGEHVDTLIRVTQEETAGFAEIEKTISKGGYNPQEVLNDLLTLQSDWDNAVEQVFGEGVDIPSGYEGRIEQMREELGDYYSYFNKLSQLISDEN